jgi:arylformamidase
MGRFVRVVSVGSLFALVAVLSGCGDGGSDAETSVKGTRPATTAPARSSTKCATSTAPTTVVYKTVEGVDANLLSLDIYPPTPSCGAPVVMWVHGGGYSVGDKKNQVADKVRLFNERGWMFVSVNYRLTRPGEPRSAQYPDHYEDVAAAVAWVYANVVEYGGDPARIALLGHSAGADIVANVVTNPTYLAKYGLGLDAVTCAGPLDTEGFDKPQAGADDPDGEQDQWQRSLGNNPNYLTETSATLRIANGIGIPPMIGVVRGTPRRRAIETQFLARLRAAGIDATTIEAGSLSHNQVNTQIGAPGDTVMTAPVVAFLTQCFGE